MNLADTTIILSDPQAQKDYITFKYIDMCLGLAIFLLFFGGIAFLIYKVSKHNP